MAQQQPSTSYGPTAVGLLALHDRQFFERLLAEPRAAMTEMVKRGALHLTAADMERVATLIAARQAGEHGDAMALWAHYHATGLWDGGDWAEGWGQYRSARAQSSR